MYGGQTIHVQAPDGKINEIIVPDGFGPGSTFTVEFADDQNDKFKPQYTPYTSSSATATATATPASSTSTSNYPTADTRHVGQDRENYDDGFASGFQNPNFVPGPVSSTSYASASIGNNNSSSNMYPMATSDAKPVY